MVHGVAEEQEEKSADTATGDVIRRLVTPTLAQQQPEQGSRGGNGALPVCLRDPCCVRLH